VSTPTTSMKTCENCGGKINPREETYDFHGHRVCRECDQLLADCPPPATATCSNCGALIGRPEEKYRHQGKIVCSECDEALVASPPPEVHTCPKCGEELGAPGREPKSAKPTAPPKRDEPTTTPPLPSWTLASVARRCLQPVRAIGRAVRYVVAGGLVSTLLAVAFAALAIVLGVLTVDVVLSYDPERQIEASGRSVIIVACDAVLVFLVVLYWAREKR